METEPLNPFQRFLFGATGAIAPEVIRWAKLAAHISVADLPTSWSRYLAIFAVYTIVGGVYASMWRDNSPLKCFYFGITFVGFVAAAAASPPSLPGAH